MASISSTLTAVGQTSQYLLLRNNEVCRLSVSRTGSGVWSADFVFAEGQAANKVTLIANFTSDQTDYEYRNQSGDTQYVAVQCRVIANGASLGVTIADVVGDQILQDWRAADGTLAFRITDQGPIGGVVGSPLNVKAFGAVGDGVTDDTAAIQRALDAATSGGIVFFPAGIYRVTDSLTPSSSTTILGVEKEWNTSANWYQSDKGSIVQADNDATLPILFDVSDRTMVSFRNMTMRVAGQNQTTNTTIGIGDITATQQCGPFVIENCQFTGFGGAVLKIGGGTSRIVGNWMRNCNSHLIWMNNYDDGFRFGSDSFIAWNDIGSTATSGADGIRVDAGGFNTILANHIFNCTNGIHLTNTSPTNRVEMNRCEKHANAGILITGASSNGNSIIANHCWNNGLVGDAGKGIEVNGGGRTLVLGNRCDQDAFSDGATSQTRGILATGNATTVSIVGNYVDSVQQYGIYVASANSQVADNFVRNIPQQGIWVEGADCAVKGNYVFNAGTQTDDTYDAILFDDGASNAWCSDNTVRHGGGSNRSRFGIRINDAAVTGAVIQGNDIVNAGRQIGISDAGTGTSSRNNRFTAGVLSGRAVLVNGTVTVSTAEVLASDNINLTRVVGAGTTRGLLSVGTITAGTSFVINSTDLSGTLSADDDSTVFWEIVH